MYCVHFLLSTEIQVETRHQLGGGLVGASWAAYLLIENGCIRRVDGVVGEGGASNRTEPDITLFNVDGACIHLRDDGGPTMGQTDVLQYTSDVLQYTSGQADT